MTMPPDDKQREATPRTDALADEMGQRHHHEGLDDFNHYYQAAGEFAQFARQLERELASALQTVAESSAALKKFARSASEQFKCPERSAECGFAERCLRNFACGKPYWMIERGSPAEWWQEGGNGGGGRYIEVWTRESLKALRFATKAQARREADRIIGFGVEAPLSVTEHIDCAALSSAVAPAVQEIVSRCGYCKGDAEVCRASTKSAAGGRDCLVGLLRDLFARSATPPSNDAKDAARYRWLRVYGFWFELASRNAHGEQLDALTDAAMIGGSDSGAKK